MEIEVGGPSSRVAQVDELPDRCYPAIADPDAGKEGGLRLLLLRGPAWGTWEMGLLWSFSGDTKKRFSYRNSDALEGVLWVVGVNSNCSDPH